MKKRFLRREARRWVADGLIDADQATRILARHDTTLDAPDPSGYRLLSALAALLVGLALLLLISAHWDQWPRLLRLSGLLVLTLALNLDGVRRFARGRGGTTTLFLGGLAYGAAIMLIGRMYHLGEHFSTGLLFWALGVTPMAWLTGGVALGLQALTVAAIWACQLAPFSPPWIMPLFLVPGFLIARRRHSVVLFLAAAVATGLWLNLLLSWTYATDFGPRWRVGLYPFDLALLLLALTLARPGLTGTAQGWLEGIFARLSLLMTFPLTFPAAWRGYMSENWGWLDPGLWATLAVLLPVLVLGNGRRRLLATGLGLAMLAVHGWGGPDQAFAAAVAGNLLVLVLALAWLRRGVIEGDSALFFTGLGGIVLLALLRYLDLIGTYLGAMALFLVMAALVWGCARYWRYRENRS